MNSKQVKDLRKNLEAEREFMRDKVVADELSARSWKAYYDRMFYSLECEKLEPEYQEYLKRQEEKRAAQRKAQEELEAKMANLENEIREGMKQPEDETVTVNQ